MKENLQSQIKELILLLIFVLLTVKARFYISNISAVNTSTSLPSTSPSVASSTTYTVEQVILDVPLISQMPELPRGCEVTSLAMILKYANIPVDKMTLAKEITKDHTAYKKQQGKIFFGNPYDGFVGDMYSFHNPGYGVYHGPVAALMEKYIPGRVVDLTEGSFDEVLCYLQKGVPVWVINNTHFSELPEEYFETWHTPTGSIQITMKEHAVVITGYDDEYIYFNDPLKNEKNRKVPKGEFIKGWRQMGKQAITYFPEEINSFKSNKFLLSHID